MVVPNMLHMLLFIYKYFRLSIVIVKGQAIDSQRQFKCPRSSLPFRKGMTRSFGCLPDYRRLLIVIMLIHAGAYSNWNFPSCYPAFQSCQRQCAQMACQGWTLKALCCLDYRFVAAQWWWKSPAQLMLPCVPYLPDDPDDRHRHAELLFRWACIRCRLSMSSLSHTVRTKISRPDRT